MNNDASATPVPSMRLGMLGIVAVALFATLIVRLWILQVVSGEQFSAEAAANRTRVVAVDAPRGRILDRNGTVVVSNRESIVVTLDRLELSEMADDDASAALQSLSSALERFGHNMDPDALRDRLADARFGPLVPVPVVSDVSEEVEVFLRERHDEYPGVSVERVWVRDYPYGQLAAHLVGYVGPITEAQLASDDAYEPDAWVGKTGVERVFEVDLRGTPGTRVIEVDALDNPVRVVEEAGTSPVPGRDVYLTIDLDLQALAEESLANELAAARARPVPPQLDPEEPPDPPFIAPAGAAVVMDPESGDVLAMASAPTYNPEVFVGGISQREWRALNSESSFSPLLNRATEGGYAPGSTFKPFTAAAAVESGLIDADETTFRDEGKYRVDECTGGTCVFRNAQDAVYGDVDLRRALTVSSDTFFYWLGESFWTERTTGRAFGDPIADYARLYGFGTPTGVQVSNEASGFVPDPDTSKQRHLDNPEAFPFGGDWFVGNNVITAIGQGEVLSTPMQLARAYGALATGGSLLAPNVVGEVREANGDLVRAIGVREVATIDIAAETQQALVDGLVGVVETSEGTADHVFADFPLERFPIAGKTGTAEVGGKADTSLFAGYGPVGAPKYVVVAVLEESGFGGESAAPLVRTLFDGLAGVTEVPAVRSRIDAIDVYLQEPTYRSPSGGAELALADVAALRPDPSATDDDGVEDSAEDSTADGAEASTDGGTAASTGDDPADETPATAPPATAPSTTVPASSAPTTTAPTTTAPTTTGPTTTAPVSTTNAPLAETAPPSGAVVPPPVDAPAPPASVDPGGDV